MSMMYKAIKEHSIIPVEIAEIGGPDKIFQLLSISSGGAYSQAQKYGELVAFYHVNERLHTGPLHARRNHDARHQLELVRSNSLENNDNIKCFIQ